MGRKRDYKTFVKKWVRRSILSHFMKVGKVFMPSNVRNGNLGDPEQHYDEFGERRH